MREGIAIVDEDGVEPVLARPAGDRRHDGVVIADLGLRLDPSVELAGLGTTLGGSPGDETHAEPYLYATLWEGPRAGELWNARDFPGAELRYADLLSSGDQREAALDFFRVRLAKLNE